MAVSIGSPSGVPGNCTEVLRWTNWHWNRLSIFAIPSVSKAISLCLVLCNGYCQNIVTSLINILGLLYRTYTWLHSVERRCSDFSFLLFSFFLPRWFAFNCSFPPFAFVLHLHFHATDHFNILLYILQFFLFLVFLTNSKNQVFPQKLKIRI